MVHTVKVQAAQDSETVAQRSGDQADPGGGAHQAEAFEPEAVAAGVNPLVEDKIDGEILHRRVQQFFHRPRNSMDFVDEKNVVFFQVGEDTDQIPALFERRPGGDRQVSPGFVGDDMRQGGFPQPRRAVKQDVVDRFLAHPGGFDGNPKRLHDFLLADIIVQAVGAKIEHFRFAVRRLTLAGNRPAIPGGMFNHVVVHSTPRYTSSKSSSGEVGSGLRASASATIRLASATLWPS